MGNELSASSGAADHRQADPDGSTDREGPLRGGVAGPLEGGEGGRQSLLHPRRGQLVQRDGDLPDGPDETREHPRYGPSHPPGVRTLKFCGAGPTRLIREND